MEAKGGNLKYFLICMVKMVFIKYYCIVQILIMFGGFGLHKGLPVLVSYLIVQATRS
jgi:hypothetical protein